MNKTIISLAVFILSSLSMYSASPFDMRFHCSEDTTKINALLKKGAESGITTANDYVVFFAKELLGTPYVAHTLEGEKEYLTINIDELDCTTFIETLFALTRSALDNNLSWRDYAKNLESIRYRNGEMGDYSTRLHYISDWIANNTYRGNVTEATGSIDGVRYEIKNINYMTANRDKYPQLSNEEIYNKIKNVEIGYRMHRYPYIKSSWVSDKKTTAGLKSGDIIALLTKIDGLDVSHMAIIVKEGNTFHMLHASSKEKKVVIEKDEFKETLRRNRQWSGIRVIRIAQ